MEKGPDSPLYEEDFLDQTLRNEEAPPRPFDSNGSYHSPLPLLPLEISSSQHLEDVEQGGQGCCADIDIDGKGKAANSPRPAVQETFLSAYAEPQYFELPEDLNGEGERDARSISSKPRSMNDLRALAVRDVENANMNHPCKESFSHVRTVFFGVCLRVVGDRASDQSESHDSAAMPRQLLPAGRQEDGHERLFPAAALPYCGDLLYVDSVAR